MIDRLPELVGLVQDAENNRVLTSGCSKKFFVMSGLRSLIGTDEFTKHEQAISLTIDMLVDIGNDPTVLNFAKANCCCLGKK